MSKNPLFSIIIPVKGRFDFVKEAVDSIFLQKNIGKKEVEIIISEEKNYGENIGNKIKKIFPEIKIVLNNDKPGPGGGRNTGLKVTKGKYIVFLDSDDQLKPEFLASMENVLKNDKKCSGAVCFSSSLFEKSFDFNERIKLYFLMVVRNVCLLISYLFNNKYLIPSSFYLCQISHMMFKSKSIRNLRFNYDYLRGGEDWDFFIQVLSCGPIRIAPRRLLIFRYSQNSSTSSSINKKLKWLSYSKLASRLSPKIKKGIYYKLFLFYIKLFRGNTF